MSTFEHKNSLRTNEAQIVQKLKNNEARPKFAGSYKKSVYYFQIRLNSFTIITHCSSVTEIVFHLYHPFFSSY